MASPVEVKLTASFLGNGAITTDSKCGTLAHEFTHKIGGDDMDGVKCATTQSILSGHRGDGNRDFNYPTAADVTTINKAMANTRTNCLTDFFDPRKRGDDDMPEPPGGDPPPQPPDDLCRSCGNCYAPPDGTSCDYSDWFDGTCCWAVYSPLIINLGEGTIKMSSAKDGVVFDLRADGHPVRIAWPTSADDAWLVFDRDGNGSIDDASEMFGTVTPLADGRHAKSGFEALEALVDSNGDRVINAEDVDFGRLMLWRDADRDGVTDPGEMVSLVSAGIREINLMYQLDQKKDRWGNLFRYRSWVMTDGKPPWHVIYDVFPTAQDASGTLQPKSIRCKAAQPRYHP